MKFIEGTEIMKHILAYRTGSFRELPSENPVFQGHSDYISLMLCVFCDCFLPCTVMPDAALWSPYPTNTE